MEKKMSIPTGDNAFLYELELTVTTELTQAETNQPEEEAVGVPIDEWLSDPADAQRYEIGLRNLLGASRPWKTASPPAAIFRQPTCRRAPSQRRVRRMARTGSPRRKVGERCRSHGNAWLRFCGWRRCRKWPRRRTRVLPDPVEYNRFLTPVRPHPRRAD
jgi:hypothetical protein